MTLAAVSIMTACLGAFLVAVPTIALIELARVNIMLEAEKQQQSTRKIKKKQLSKVGRGILAAKFACLVFLRVLFIAVFVAACIAILPTGSCSMSDMETTVIIEI